MLGVGLLLAWLLTTTGTLAAYAASTWALGVQPRVSGAVVEPRTRSHRAGLQLVRRHTPVDAVVIVRPVRQDDSWLGLSTGRRAFVLDGHHYTAHRPLAHRRRATLTGWFKGELPPEPPAAVVEVTDPLFLLLVAGDDPASYPALRRRFAEVDWLEPVEVNHRAALYRLRIAP